MKLESNNFAMVGRRRNGWFVSMDRLELVERAEYAVFNCGFAVWQPSAGIGQAIIHRTRKRAFSMKWTWLLPHFMAVDVSDAFCRGDPPSFWSGLFPRTGTETECRFPHQQKAVAGRAA